MGVIRRGGQIVAFLLFGLGYLIFLSVAALLLTAAYVFFGFTSFSDGSNTPTTAAIILPIAITVLLFVFFPQFSSGPHRRAQEAAALLLGLAAFQYFIDDKVRFLNARQDYLNGEIERSAAEIKADILSLVCPDQNQSPSCIFLTRYGNLHPDSFIFVFLPNELLNGLGAGLNAELTLPTTLRLRDDARRAVDRYLDNLPQIEMWRRRGGGRYLVPSQDAIREAFANDPAFREMNAKVIALELAVNLSDLISTEQQKNFLQIHRRFGNYFSRIIGIAPELFLPLFSSIAALMIFGLGLSRVALKSP